MGCPALHRNKEYKNYHVQQGIFEQGLSVVFYGVYQTDGGCSSQSTSLENAFSIPEIIFHIFQNQIL